MRIGIDVDGVLACFTDGFCDLAERKLGKTVSRTPDCWEWADKYLTKEEQGVLWSHIKSTPSWWGRLRPVDSTPATLKTLDRWVDLNYDLYAITTRPGAGVQRVTMDWLVSEFGISIPVIVTRNAEHKAEVAAALKLTHFVDDNVDNCREVMGRGGVEKVCLFDATHNQHCTDIPRITTIEELC